MKTRFNRVVMSFCIILLGVPSLAHAALIGRLPATPGGTDYQAYYDDDLNITWAANANINGAMDWATANAWAASLTIGGVSGWRLPNTAQPDPNCDAQADSGALGIHGFGYGCTGSEMGHLFYDELGGTQGNSILWSSDPDLAKFSNIQSGYYWSATEFALNTDAAWVFLFHAGDQYFSGKTISNFAWAVHSGDVSAVPIPGAVWLFGSGLIGLLSMAHRTAARDMMIRRLG